MECHFLGGMQKNLIINDLCQYPTKVKVSGIPVFSDDESFNFDIECIK